MVQNNLRDIINAKGFEFPTKAKLNELGVTLIMYNKILNNKKQPTPDLALDFCEWLGVSLNEFWTRPRTMKRADARRKILKSL